MLTTKVGSWLFLKTQNFLKNIVTQFHNNADNEGCFSFLGEEAKLTWIDATLACEQVISLGEPLNEAWWLSRGGVSLLKNVQLICSCISMFTDQQSISLLLGSNVHCTGGHCRKIGQISDLKITPTNCALIQNTQASGYLARLSSLVFGTFPSE